MGGGGYSLPYSYTTYKLPSKVPHKTLYLNIINIIELFHVTCKDEGMEYKEKIERLMRVVNKGDLDEYGWHVVQFTEEEAKEFHESQMEKDITDLEVVNMQLYQIRKCSNRFFGSLGGACKFPNSGIILLSHDLCVNAQLNLPNDEKYNFTRQECLDWVNRKMT